MRSNLAIAEEMRRIAGYLRPLEAGEVSCPNSQCKLFGVPMSLAHDVSYGQTAAGTLPGDCLA